MVWTLILQPESEGPALISCAAGCFDSVVLMHRHLLSAPSWRTIIREPELHLGEDIVVPDWVDWRRERMPELPETAYVTLRPDWVCEILSDSRRRLELNDKRTVYAREGVEHLWLVDLAARTLEAFELREGEWALVASAKDDDQVSTRPFEVIKVNLGELWR